MMRNTVSAINAILLILSLLVSCGKNPASHDEEQSPRIAFINPADNRLYVGDLDHGNVQRISFAHISDEINEKSWIQFLEDSSNAAHFTFYHPRWNDEGNMIAVGVAEMECSQLMIVDIENDTGYVVSSNLYFVDSPDWSPDGSQLAFAQSTSYWSTFSEINCVDLISKIPHQLTTHSRKLGGNLVHPRWSGECEYIYFTVTTDPAKPRGMYRYSFDGDSVESFGTYYGVTSFSRAGKALSRISGLTYLYDPSTQTATQISQGPEDQYSRFLDNDSRVIYTKLLGHNIYESYLYSISDSTTHKLAFEPHLYIEAYNLDIWWP